MQGEGEKVRAREREKKEMVYDGSGGSLEAMVGRRREKVKERWCAMVVATVTAKELVAYSGGDGS